MTRKLDEYSFHPDFALSAWQGGKRAVTDGGTDNLDPATHTHIVDGAPRLSHKTTKLVQSAWEFDIPIVKIDSNYEQVHESARNHFGGGTYGVDADTIVIPMGKDRASEYCPDDCTHEVDGGSYGRIQHYAREVAASNTIVEPQTFVSEDVCAYQATKFAISHADAVISVPEMFFRVSNASYFPDNYQVLIDEESTQDWSRPSDAKIGEIRPSSSDLGPPFIVDLEITEESVENLLTAEKHKIDELERVPTRYRNVERAAEWAEKLLKRISDYDFSDPPEDVEEFGFDEKPPEEEIEKLDELESEHAKYAWYIENLNVGSAAFDGPLSEKSATFDRIRMDYHRFAASTLLEPAFFEPEIHVTPSGDKLDIRVIPDPTSEFLVNKGTYENAEKMWLVGDLGAKDFAEKMGREYEYTLLEPKQRDLDDLKLMAVEVGEEHDEYDRRAFLTDVSKELAENRIAHPMFAGSGLRAQQAGERIGPPSYFFNAEAERRHYQEMADIGYAITSYPGSRISRGVDLPTNVSVVRSTHFKTGIWDYRGSDEDTALKTDQMRRYSREIEVHNMMLRGSGQGERHVAVVPSITPYFGLLETVEQWSTEDDVKALVNDIIAYIEGVEERGEMYWCGECETGFVSMAKFLEHRTEGRCTGG